MQSNRGWLLATLLTLILLNGAWAAPGRRTRQGSFDPYGRLYNPRTVQTVTGRVTSVESRVPRHGAAQAIHVTLRTRHEVLDVHLGPSWYLRSQHMMLRPGDRLRVTGSRVTLYGRSAMIASEVRKGHRVLTLRNHHGIPVWSGGGGRRWHH